MNDIISALKSIKQLFPQVAILNNKDKNGNKCIVLLNIDSSIAFNEVQLKSIPEFNNLYLAVDTLADDGVTISYTDPTKSSKQDGKGLIFIGKSNVEELDINTISLS